MSTRVNVNNATGIIDYTGTTLVPAVAPTGTGETMYVNSAGTAYISQSVSPTFKNRVINGDMTIDQRNSGASVSSTNGSAAFAVDRWPFYNGAATAISAQQSSTAPTGFSKSLQISTTTAVNSTAAQQIYLIQRIEGFNVSDLQYGTASAQTISVSFWVRSSVTGTYATTVALFPVGGSNVSSYISTYTISQANTWEKKTLQIPGNQTYAIPNTSNGVGIYFSFDLGSGTSSESTSGNWIIGDVIRTSGCVKWANNANATFFITGVQLESGSVATDFELRPQQIELALCQRYYGRLAADASGGGVDTMFGSGTATTTVLAFIYCKYPTTMRATPTIGLSGLRLWDGVNTRTASTFGTVYYGSDSANISVNSATLTAGRAYVLLANTVSTAYVDFSAEL